MYPIKSELVLVGTARTNQISNTPTKVNYQIRNFILFGENSYP
jgi:hypothetical protein